MHYLRRAGVTLVCGLIAWASPGAEIITHRGASYEAPEKTLAAFDGARRENADAVELNAEDGKVVVLHDKMTRRITGIDLSVGEAPLAP